jgi:hypothetical protein
VTNRFWRAGSRALALDCWIEEKEPSSRDGLKEEKEVEKNEEKIKEEK